MGFFCLFLEYLVSSLQSPFTFYLSLMLLWKEIMVFVPGCLFSWLGTWVRVHEFYSTHYRTLVSFMFPFLRVNPKWVIYHSLVSTDRQYMRNVIAIDPSWLIEAAPHFYQLQKPNTATYWLLRGCHLGHETNRSGTKGEGLVRYPGKQKYLTLMVGGKDSCGMQARFLQNPCLEIAGRITCNILQIWMYWLCSLSQ